MADDQQRSPSDSNASDRPEDRDGGAEYSDEELERYFNDPRHRDRSSSEEGAASEARSEANAPGQQGPSTPRPRSSVRSEAQEGAQAARSGPAPGGSRPRHGVRGFGFFHRHLGPQKAQAAFVLSLLAGIALLATLALAVYVASLAIGAELPSTKQIENPEFDLATVAYTADGEVLARYALQNRSWATFDQISEHVKEALVSTEDHRFYNHWGMDLFRTFSAVAQTLLGDRQGGSTITQQLARNLYNKQIGRDISVQRKVKEMITAVQIERNYTKREIIEMYLNTVEFGNNAFGIEAAAQTYYDTTAAALNPLQAATFVGMLKAPTYYDPIDHPERAQMRRNVVLRQMRKHDVLPEGYYAAHKDEPTKVNYQSSALSASLAPYFAEFVRGWMKQWAAENNRDFYTGGLRVHTTLDAQMQKLANAAVQEQTRALQKVVDYEWSRESNYFLSENLSAYEDVDPEEPFDYFWRTHPKVVADHARATERYQYLVDQQDLSEDEALEQLKSNEAFMDSLRNVVTHLSAGLVSLDPRTGYVKTWVGGRNFEEEKYDKVATAQRQPGSTFKPFVYTAAIDNGYSPYYTLRDSAFTYTMEGATAENKNWTPSNFGGSTGQMRTLREGLANSLNTITARVMMKLVNPQEVAFYARHMGIRESELTEVPALALGASEVTLLELVSAYATLANGGLYNAPQVVTRIEDRSGNVLYEAQPAPEEALPEQTAFTVVDMLRDVVDYGTGSRIRWQWDLGDYDLAGKTGTTQENADGWFMLMHPQLVTGAWVGFNDRRVAFRSTFWGQGAHNALFLVGDYFQRLTRSEQVDIAQSEKFPMPALPEEEGRTRTAEGDDEEQNGQGRVGW